MNALKHWKMILVVLLVFAAGAVTGSVGTTIHFKHAFERGLKVENWIAHAMNVLQTELKLTPEQQPRIRAIVEDTGRQFQRSFGQATRESGTNLVASWRRIDQELTPEQKVIHHQMCQKFRDGVNKTLKIDLPPQ